MKRYHDAVKARLTPHVPGAREVIAACLFLACASALGQSVIDSIRFPCPAPLPGGRHSLAYDYGDRLLYVGGDGCESLFVIDDRRGAMVGAVWLGDSVTAICYNPLVNRVYCGTKSGSTVQVIEPGTNRVLQRLEVDDNILAFVLDTAANRLFCVGGSGKVPVINCAANTVERTVELPASFDVGVATCYVPPLRRMYVAAESDSALFVLDCARESLLTTIRLGHGPSALCYNPANGKLYTASRDDTTLKVVDPATNTVIASLPGLSGAEWLCSNATSNKVYAMGEYLSIYDGRNDSLRTDLYMGYSAYNLLVWDSRHNVVYMTCSTWDIGGIAVIDGVTDSLDERLLPYAEASDAALYSAEADRLYCVWGGISALQASTRRMCWFIPNEYEYDGPWDICADTARGKLYCGYWPTGISVVDLSKRAVTADLAPGSIDNEPVSGCVNSHLDKNYILMNDGELLVIDAVADTVIALMRLDSTPRWSLCACAAQAGRVLCTAEDSSFGVLIDCTTDSVTSAFRLEHPASVIETGPDGASFLVATPSALYVIDARTGAIPETLRIGSYPSAMCYASDARKFYCADTVDECVYVVSVSEDSLVGNMDLGGKPYGLCYDSDDARVYVACADPDRIYALDCASDSVTACTEFAGTRLPSTLAYSAFGNRMYFTYGDSLGTIDCNTNMIGWLPFSPYGSRVPHVFPGLHLVSVMSATSEYVFFSVFTDPPARRYAVASDVQAGKPTVVRSFLSVTGARIAQLYDLSGRRVLDLLPGLNDVSAIPRGVYFEREQTGGEPVKTRKVVIVR